MSYNQTAGTILIIYLLDLLILSIIFVLKLKTYYKHDYDSFLR